MLSYQHIYHAGNFADVQKHALLAQVLKSLAAKPAPMAVLDMHAGRGLYHLSDTEAEKNREFDNGITALWAARDRLPAALKPYMDILTALNTGDTVEAYPGSAWIARHMLRPSEKLTAIERHPGEFTKLRDALGGKPQTLLLQDDSLKILPEKIPFAERRGLVICDPSYEIKTEYATIAQKIYQAWKKWPQGCYFIWYPCMDAKGHVAMLSDLRKSGVTNMLVSEITLEQPPEAHFRMYGSGIAIINPPWPMAVMQSVTDAVVAHLPTPATGEVFWLDDYHVDPQTGRLQK